MVGVTNRVRVMDSVRFRFLVMVRECQDYNLAIFHY